MVRQIGIRVVDGIAGVGRRRTRGRGGVPPRIPAPGEKMVLPKAQKEGWLGRKIGDLSVRAFDYLRKTKLISNKLKQWGHPNVSKLAGTLGFGRRRRTYRRKRRTMGGKLPLHKISVVHGGGRRAHLPPRSDLSM